MEIKAKIGEIVFNDLKHISNLPFEEQELNFKEDLLQIKYKEYVLDIGWFPSFEVDGNFVLCVVKENEHGEVDWIKPCLRKEFGFSTVEELQKEIDKGLDFMKKEVNNSLT